VRLIEGRSTATDIVAQVRALAADRRVMVILDSDHGFENVTKELEQLAPLVTPGCYLIVEDTALGSEYFPNAGDPGGALAAWLTDHPGFQPDLARDRFSVTQTPGGYVHRRY
jgi:cephalosporin hydroxylase